MEPEALKFTESHEWVSVDGDEATIGITDHAQSEMNDIIYVELPATGTTPSTAERARISSTAASATTRCWRRRATTR